jgi:hypothetical protein
MLLTQKARTALLKDAQKNAELFVLNELELSDKAFEQFSKNVGDKFVEQETSFNEAVASIKTELLGQVKTLFEQALEDHRKKRYESDEPFVEIVSEDFTSEGGVQLRLDWNTAFITYLKKNGFNGATDEQIVDTWLVSLSNSRIAESGAASQFK